MFTQQTKDSCGIVDLISGFLLLFRRLVTKIMIFKIGFNPDVFLVLIQI